MSEVGTVQKINDWLTLLLAVVFIAFGMGIVTGILFPGRLFMGETMRTILGLVIMGYGVMRIIMIGRRLKSLKRKKSLTKNA
jgi:hypothetical protein